MAQKLLAKALGSQVDVNIYAARRDAMKKVLDDAGYSYPMPRGAFYFFPQAPGGDDVAFVSGHGPMSTIGAERRSNPFCGD